MTIALFGKNYPEYFSKYIQHLIKKLENEHVKIIMEKNLFDFIKDKIRFQKIPEIYTNHHELVLLSPSFLFSIGGDGTLLNAVTYVRDSDIPILGINTGRLGFISSIVI